MKNATGVIQQNQNTTMLLNQLKRSEKQYPPLSKDEERELISKYKDDRQTLNKLLCMHNIRLVFNIAKKYKGKTDDFDNMVQNGYLGLMQAANRFDIDKGIKFVTYAYPWVMKFILSEFYAKNKEIDQNSCSLNQSPSEAGHNDTNGNEVEDFVNSFVDPSICHAKTVHEELSANEQQQLVGSLIDAMNSDVSLSATDKNVFMDIFYNRERPSDVADKYELTMHDVNEIKRKILGKFKTQLKMQYNINSYADVP